MRLAEISEFSDDCTILITGATGNLGSKIARHLSQSEHRLILLDQIPHPNLPVHTANLSSPGRWMDLFRDVDVVIHLAGTAKLNSSPETYKRENIDCTANVLSACRKHGVRRIVFGSSLRVMGGYRKSGKRIVETLKPYPEGFFGQSKSTCEAMLADFPDVIALRLGWCPRQNVREAVLGAPERLREMWLSDNDFLQAVELSITADNQGFTPFNITSNVANNHYPLKQARKILGYKPQDRLNKTQILLFKVTHAFSGRARGAR